MKQARTKRALSAGKGRAASEPANARRRRIARAYLAEHDIAPMTSREAAAFERELEVEAAAWRRRFRKR